MARLSIINVFGCLPFAAVPVSCHNNNPGDSPHNHQPPQDHAVVQSFTFQLADNESPWIGPEQRDLYRQNRDPNLLLNRDTPKQQQQEQQQQTPQNVRDGSSLFQQRNGKSNGKDHFAIVSTESVYSEVPEDREWEAYREASLASWRQFMFDEKDDDDSDDSDDDANDGDGSCSILSNDSVYMSEKNAEARARLVAIRYQQQHGTSRKHQEAAAEDRNRRRKSYGTSSHRLLKRVSRTETRHRKRNVDPHTMNTLGSFLNVRGGAEASSGTIEARGRVGVPGSIVRGGAACIGSEAIKKLLVSAIVTLIFEWSIGHICEFIKIDMQTSTASKYNYLDSIQSITKQKGIGGLWDGFIPWGFIQSVCKGSVFGFAHHVATSILIPCAQKGIIPVQVALVLAGGIAGMIQGYALSPTLLLKTRVMTDPVFRKKMSAGDTLRLSASIGYNVVKKEGMVSLMKGANVFATKRMFDWATRYFFADMFEAIFARYLKAGESLSLMQKSYASLLGGVFSTISTLPLDVLVSKIQDAKKAGVSVSAWELFQQELQQKGWAGLRRSYLRGFEARLLHVCLTVVVMKTLAPVAYGAIFGSSKNAKKEKSS